jgi:hypothetical protein
MAEPLPSAASTGFFDIREVRADDAAALSGALRDIHAGVYSGLLVRAAFPAAEMGEAAARLARGSVSFDTLRFGPGFEAYMLGRGLDFADDLEGYLDGEAAWSASCDRLFDGLTSFEERLDQLFGSLGSPLPVTRPRLRGRLCLPDTFRRLPPGGRIPPHAEMEQTTRPPYAELNPLLDGVTLISYFVCLAPGTAGGELAIHDLRWRDVDESVMHRGRTRVEHLLEKAEPVRVRPDAGDLLIFDGGRCFHEVLPVLGDETRWTGGGFLAMARDGACFYRWS